MVVNDPQTLRHVRDALADAGYSPVVTGDHRELAGIVRTEKPALVLLDLALPGADGIGLMQTVPELARQPVIFISGYDRDETVARALEAGAADYIVKPFSPTELVARVRAALRRHAGPEPFVLGELAIDYDRRLVHGGREERSSLPRPNSSYCARAVARCGPRCNLRSTAGRHLERGASTAAGRWLRAFVKQLRAKLGDNPADPTWIFNVPRCRLPHAPAGRDAGGLTASSRASGMSSSSRAVVLAACSSLSIHHAGYVRAVGNGCERNSGSSWSRLPCEFSPRIRDGGEY